MKDDEVLSTPLDNRRTGGGLPGEGRARDRDVGNFTPGRAILWNAVDTPDFAPPAVWGAYPVGFCAYAMKAMRCPPSSILHVCSGSLSASEVLGGVRVDLRGAACPDVCADGRSLPFRDETFSGVLIDPPYSTEYALELYGTDYPRPSHLLMEASRVLRAGGRLGFLHFLVPMPMPGTMLQLEYVKGITQGCGYRIRALTVFVKRAPDLFE